MKILFTTPAGLGHLNPMLPLVQAMVRRGHTVLWALPTSGVEHLDGSGIQTVGTTGSSVRIDDLMRAHPELRELSPEQRPNAMFGKLFGAHATPPMLADLAPVAADFRPDLVVCDAAEFAGHIVAAERGVPAVTKGFGMLLPERRVAAAADEVAPLWRARGLEPRPYAGCYDHLYLDVYPPALPSEPAPHVLRRQLLRQVTESGPVDGSIPLPTARPDSPLVYVTLGTVFNDPGPFHQVLRGLAELDVRVLVTVGPTADPEVLGEQPPHVRVERYVSQSAVLPLCGAVVSHAGSGTALATLEQGLPQLCVPQGADQFLNARAIVAAGAGLSLLPGEADADAVRDAVRRLLEDPSYRAAAEVVSASIRSMPSPDEVAAVLEALPS